MLSEDEDEFIPAGRHVTITYPHIGRTQSSDVYTRMMRKDYRPCYEKGRIRPGMETLPFGHGREGADRRRIDNDPLPMIPTPPQIDLTQQPGTSNSLR